jgi:hypothetical protein
MGLQYKHPYWKLVPDKDENPRFDIPWHAATLIKEWAQYIVPLQFYIL